MHIQNLVLSGTVVSVASVIKLLAHPHIKGRWIVFLAFVSTLDRLPPEGADEYIGEGRLFSLRDEQGVKRPA